MMLSIPFTFFAFSLLCPSIQAHSDESCANEDIRKGGSLIQVKSGSAPTSISAASAAGITPAVNTALYGDVLMATADGKFELKENSQGDRGFWPFDSITDAISHAAKHVSDAVSGPSKKKVGRFQKVNMTKGGANATNNTFGREKFNGTILGKLTYDQLPQELQNMGESFFGSRENVVTLLANTNVANITYGGTVITIAFRNNDEVYQRFCAECPQGQEYGLERLLEKASAIDQAFEQRRDTAPGHMINIIDIGGHIGVISLAVYKRYPGQVRAVVVEPVRLSYFYLMINLWLNDVPSIPVEEGGMPGAGITAIQKAITEAKDVQVQMCVPQHAFSTMRSYAITSQTTVAQHQGCSCCENGCPDACVGVLSTTMEMIFGFFPDEDVTLLKVDCEGCETFVLQALENPVYGQRVKKLAIEMHDQGPVVALKACEQPGHVVRGTCPSAPSTYLAGIDYCSMCAGKAE